MNNNDNALCLALWDKTRIRLMMAVVVGGWGWGWVGDTPDKFFIKEVGLSVSVSVSLCLSLSPPLLDLLCSRSLITSFFLFCFFKHFELKIRERGHAGGMVGRDFNRRCVVVLYTGCFMTVGVASLASLCSNAGRDPSSRGLLPPQRHIRGRLSWVGFGLVPLNIW